MNPVFTGNTAQERLRSRMEWVNRSGVNTIGGDMQLELLECDIPKGEYLILAHTKEYMRNVIGTLHGGSCAAMIDQAMGCIANSLHEGEGHAPTSQLQICFHRPMFAGLDYRVKVRVVSISRSMIHLSAQVYSADHCEKLCCSGSATFFRPDQE